MCHEGACSERKPRLTRIRFSSEWGVWPYCVSCLFWWLKQTIPVLTDRERRLLSDEVGANLHKTYCYRKDPSPRGKVDFAKQKTVEARFGICNLLLRNTSSTIRRRFRRKLVRNAKHFEYTSSVTRFYCLTQFLSLWCVPPSPWGEGITLTKLSPIVLNCAVGGSP